MYHPGHWATKRTGITCLTSLNSETTVYELRYNIYNNISLSIFLFSSCDAFIIRSVVNDGWKHWTDRATFHRKFMRLPWQFGFTLNQLNSLTMLNCRQRFPERGWQQCQNTKPAGIHTSVPNMILWSSVATLDSSWNSLNFWDLPMDKALWVAPTTWTKTPTCHKCQWLEMPTSFQKTIQEITAIVRYYSPRAASTRNNETDWL